ncbi:hypothetical protein Taro_045761 [Colocasia esculenta]|uniref:Uncharacterized protein n=1 Tax=Colocasia esculenta TaxID=4460 RepID=A0A843X384_COLES|nr:hypothetical protein [Colocasia esculenta]
MLRATSPRPLRASPPASVLRHRPSANRYGRSAGWGGVGELDSNRPGDEGLPKVSDEALWYTNIWGVKEGPYEFKPAPTPAPSSSFSDIFSPLNLPPLVSLENRIEGSFVMEE